MNESERVRVNSFSNSWQLLDDRRGGSEDNGLPLEKPSMLEKETYVSFDKIRSRGSDMKLLQDASAVKHLH